MNPSYKGNASFPPPFHTSKQEYAGVVSDATANLLMQASKMAIRQSRQLVIGL